MLPFFVSQLRAENGPSFRKSTRTEQGIRCLRMGKLNQIDVSHKVMQYVLKNLEYAIKKY